MPKRADSRRAAQNVGNCDQKWYTRSSSTPSSTCSARRGGGRGRVNAPMRRVRRKKEKNGAGVLGPRKWVRGNGREGGGYPGVLMCGWVVYVRPRALGVGARFASLFKGRDSARCTAMLLNRLHAQKCRPLVYRRGCAPKPGLALGISRALAGCPSDVLGAVLAAVRHVVRAVAGLALGHASPACVV